MADVNKTVEVRYKASTKDLEKGLDNVNKKSGSTFKKIGKAAAAATAAFVATAIAIQKASQKIADLTNELTDASTKTGIAIDTLAGLRLAAEGSGKSFGQLESGLIKFNMVVGQADQGMAAASKIFQQMGVDVHDLDGGLKDTGALFEEVRKKLGQMGDGAARNTKLMELFGRSAGPALLQSGAIDNLQAMVEATRVLGVDTTPQAIASAAEFQRQMAELGMVSQGVLQDMLNAITGGPDSVNNAITSITKAIIYFGGYGSAAIEFVRFQFKQVGLLINMVAQGLVGNFAGVTILKKEMQKSLGDYRARESAGDKIVRQLAALDQLHRSRAAEGRKEAAAEEKTYKFKLKKEDEEVKALKKKLSLEKEIAAFREQAANVIDNDFKKLFDNYREDIKRAKEIAKIKLGISEDEIDALRELMFVTRKESSKKDFTDVFENTEESLKALHELDVALNVEYDKLISDMNEKRADKEKKTLDELIKKEKERRDMQIAGAESVMSNTISAADGIRQVLETTGNMSKEQSATLFKIQQGLAVSEIAMNTAIGVSNAWAQFGAFPPLATAATVAILAAGAAQSAVVMTQQPPKFDTGGMIGNNDPLQPDQKLIRAQTGEAVLDRATVNRLGGEKGVRNLQGGGSQVVILNPWKHLDRWNASARRMGTTLGSMTPATGQRGY